MPSVAIGVRLSTGHGCFPPSPTSQSTLAKTAFFNGEAIQLRQYTHYTNHQCVLKPYPIHTEVERIISESGGTFFMEGFPVSLIGDTIGDGDTVAHGSRSAFVR